MDYEPVLVYAVAGSSFLVELEPLPEYRPGIKTDCSRTVVLREVAEPEKPGAISLMSRGN